MVNSNITLEAAHLFMWQIYGTDVGGAEQARSHAVVGL